MISASFDSTKTPLQELLSRSATGKTIACQPEIFHGVVAEGCDEGPEEWDTERLFEDAVVSEVVRTVRSEPLRRFRPYLQGLRRRVAGGDPGALGGEPASLRKR
jgi:hypothetical protein